MLGNPVVQLVPQRMGGTKLVTSVLTDVQAAWTDEEERAFAEVVDKIITENIWAAAKNNPLLHHRGANGMRAHWKAKVSRRAPE